MAAQRVLRVSSYGDYVAVDLVENGQIINTPFNVGKGGSRPILAWDAEEETWVASKAKLEDGKIVIEDADFGYTIDPSSLLNEAEYIFQPICKR